jgi:acetyl esterase/lipase
MENIVDVDALIESRQRRDDAGESEQETEPTTTGLRLPDAIMLSCPALNLTLELSPSRVMGIEDPVLPSGLISAISDAYIPSALGTSKKDPLASPFYAPDDPLLDDSIYFNRRLQSLGVESELRAASHMPHAYWGLGTAGFPEAKQVQHECEEWLVRQLAK